MSTADSNKGWTFTFRVEDQEDPARVVVLGEVGNVEENTWMDEDALFYMDDDHAMQIAKDALLDHLDEELEAWWIETRDFHPDDLVGLNEYDIGVWL